MWFFSEIAIEVGIDEELVQEQAEAVGIKFIHAYCSETYKFLGTGVSDHEGACLIEALKKNKISNM